jgi:hypothetical protein
MIKLTKQDCERISRLFPQLNCEYRKQRLWGTLAFTCYYDEPKGKLVHQAHPDSISDTYEIEIKFDKFHLKLPRTYETSGIVADHAKKTGTKLLDLHMFKKDNACCLGIYPEDEYRTAYEFLVERVVPYFYWQSHIRIHGKEPWKAYPHGKAGYVEKRRELSTKIHDIEKQMSDKTIAGIGSIRNKPCECGSNKKYKSCCLNKDDRLRAEFRFLGKHRATVGKWIAQQAKKDTSE